MEERQKGRALTWRDEGMDVLWVEAWVPITEGRLELLIRLGAKVGPDTLEKKVPFCGGHGSLVGVNSETFVHRELLEED